MKHIKCQNLITLNVNNYVCYLNTQTQSTHVCAFVLATVDMEWHVHHHVGIYKGLAVFAHAHTLAFPSSLIAGIPTPPP